MTAVSPPVRGDLAPVRRRGVWIAWGLALQVIGVAIPVVAAVERANHDSVIAAVTHYTVRLVLHEMLRRRADVALVLLGVLVFVAGSIVLARPFVTRRLTLLVAVPAAAVTGVVLLGLIAVVIAALVALATQGSGDIPAIDWPFGDRRNRRR